MYKKKIHFQMFGMFFCFCYVIWTAILVVVRPALCQRRGDLKSLTVSFLLFCFFLYLLFFRRDGVSVLFSCKRESLAFTFLFLLPFLNSDKSISEGCAVFRGACC